MESPNSSAAATSSARLAAAYLLSHGDLPVSIDDLALRCQTSVRSLYRAFLHEYGTTPLRFLKRARLERIHADLRVAEPGMTVTHVAFRWGVTHLGRFAQEYARCFGEPPSATLRRAAEARTDQSIRQRRASRAA